MPLLCVTKQQIWRLWPLALQFQYSQTLYILHFAQTLVTKATEGLASATFQIPVPSTVLSDNKEHKVLILTFVTPNKMLSGNCSHNSIRYQIYLRCRTSRVALFLY